MTRIWMVASGVWMLGILGLSLLPRELGGTGGSVWHFIGYGVLAVLLGAWQPAGRTIAVAWGYGAIIEGLQGLVPYRDAEVIDLLVNALGVAVGTLVRVAIRHVQRPIQLV